MSNLAIFNSVIRAEKTQNYLTDVLREKKDSFVTSLVSVVTNNTMLQACDPQTIMYAAMKATSLSLPVDPSLGFAYVIPYKNKGKDEAQLQIGYKGITQLAMRSGQFKSINADAVYEGEISKVDRKSGDIELDGEKKSNKIVGYFAYFQLLNGFEKTLYMSKEEVQAHANRFSKAVSYGPWKSDFDAMAKKTVLKSLLSKYAPMSVEMQSAIKADQAVYRDASMTEDYVDNQEQPDVQEHDAQVEKVKAKAEVIRERARKAAEARKEESEPEEETEGETAPAPGYEDAPSETEDEPDYNEGGMFDNDGNYKED